MNQESQFNSTTGIIVVIGGVVFNHVPTLALSQINAQLKFIDINSFAAPFDLNDITQKIGEIIYSYKQPVIIIGYSTGGLVAMNLANQMTYLVSKIILINSTPCFLSKDNWQGIRSPDFCRLEKKLADLSLEQFKHHFSWLAAYPQVYKLAQLSQWQSSFCNKENLASWLEIIAMTDLRQQLSQIVKPVLVIYSELDHLVPRSNDLENRVFTKYILHKSSHAVLNSLALIDQVEQFIL